MKNIETQQLAPQSGEVILYNPDDTIRLEVRMNEENVWLNRSQIAQLFGRDVKTIGKHINNALREELNGLSVVANFATTASDGKTYMKFGQRIFLEGLILCRDMACLVSTPHIPILNF